MIIYRLGEPKDISAMTQGAIEISKIFAEANQTQVDEDGIKEFMDHFFDMGLARPLLAFEQTSSGEEKIAGGLFLLVDKMFFVKDPFLRDRGLFVFPEYRSQASRIAYMLTRWACDIARENNMNYQPQVDTLNSNADNLYRKMGGVHLGGAWLFPKGQYKRIGKK